MGEYEGSDMRGIGARRLAESAVFRVIAQGAVLLVVGILIWGFNRIDGTLERLNGSIVALQILVTSLDRDRTDHSLRLRSLEERQSKVETQVRILATKDRLSIDEPR